MKKISTLIAVLLMTFQTANALIVSVDGYGEISKEGMNLTLTEAEEDPMTEVKQMNLDGDLLCSSSLTVTVTRSEAGLNDEFCCAGQCKAGNGEKSEVFQYQPGGIATWFAHYTPVPYSDVTIVYVFSDGTESRTLSVHYIYQAEGVESVAAPKTAKGIYSIDGTLLNAEGKTEALPDGVYIRNGKKMIKTTH